jgi:hypothetical protein
MRKAGRHALTEAGCDGTITGGMRCPRATTPKSNFRFTPESGLRADIAPCPFRAMKRHGEFHSITSSARASSVGGMVRPISLAVKIDDGRKLNRQIDGPGTLGNEWPEIPAETPYLASC